MKRGYYKITVVKCSNPGCRKTWEYSLATQRKCPYCGLPRRPQRKGYDPMTSGVSR